ncbi:hypothetical protein K2173_004427 [Erythroxylum novogranatense]|uniref:VQ domain-containing protein n=1 Tax=Erythroxylum novogranatense TaxID=1862640 RepID=A0AAV8T4F3_9ROSI|nr:hypothetical protein K2173_004427 [Erythroxylum novogranatense]
MEISSPRHKDKHNPQSLIPSPASTSSSISNSTPTTNCVVNNTNPFPSPRLINRSEPANPCPTTFVQADTSSFKQVVQMLTGSPRTTTIAPTTSQTDSSPKPHSSYSIPPIKTMPKKNQSSGFKLYERRSSLKTLKINPLNPILAPPSSGFSPRKPEILSPSILDFPALTLSPVTPLISDPFDRSATPNYTNCHGPLNNSSIGNLLNTDAEDKAIKERGFYFHPPPASTTGDIEPRLLSLFPVTSPTISGLVLFGC